MPVDGEVYELNEGHILEATDRLHVACVYIDQILGRHPLLNSVSDFRSEVDKVSEILANLYQKVSHFDSVKEIARTCELADAYRIKD